MITTILSVIGALLGLGLVGVLLLIGLGVVILLTVRGIISLVQFAIPRRKDDKDDERR